MKNTTKEYAIKKPLNMGLLNKPSIFPTFS